MNFCIVSLIFSIFIQITHMRSFQAEIESTDLGISSNSYFSTDGVTLKLLKPLTVEDNITIEYILQTEALEYMELDVFDVIRTETISLCNPDLNNEEHWQVLRALMNTLLIDFTQGCPIGKQEVLPYEGEFVMNFNYFDYLPPPSCEDLDWLLIYLHSPTDPEPLLLSLMSITNHAVPFDCLDY